jgi:hypothetical protein
MKSPGPFLSVGITAAMLFTACPGAHAVHDDENGDTRPIARLTMVEGDIRYSPNNERLEPSKPWEQAEEDMDIEQKSALATEKGRAEIEFQNGTKIFLAENSILTFQKLRERHGALNTHVTLVAGTATVFIPKTTSDSLYFESQVHLMKLQAETLARMDSYSNGTAITPQADGGFVDAAHKEIKFAKGQGLFYPVGETSPQPGVQVPAQPGWDQWANWWAPHPRTSPPDCTGSLGKLDPACLQAENIGQFKQCSSFEIPLNRGCWCPGSLACPGGAQGPFLDTNLRKHHKHYTWVRVGKTVGFVPKNPKDRKGQPPVNLKYGLLVLSKQLGKPPERLPFNPSEKVTVLSKPPREFRDGLAPEMTRVSAPQSFARSVEESMPRGLSADGSRANGGGGANSGRGESPGTSARTNGGGGKSTGEGHSSSSNSGARGSSSGGSGASGSSGGHYSGGGSSSGGGGHDGGGYSGGSSGGSSPSGGGGAGGGGGRGPR